MVKDQEDTGGLEGLVEHRAKQKERPKGADILRGSWLVFFRS